MENVTEKVNLRTAFAKHILFESTHRADARPTEAEYRAPDRNKLLHISVHFLSD